MVTSEVDAICVNTRSERFIWIINKSKSPSQTSPWPAAPWLTPV